MSYLNLTVLEKETGKEKKASIPKKIVDFYVFLTANALGQDPKEFNVSRDNVTGEDFENFLRALVINSSKNIGVYINEIHKTFLPPKDTSYLDNSYLISMFLDKEPFKYSK